LQSPRFSASAVLYPSVTEGQELPVADLDWATGIVRMFIGVDEWQKLLTANRATLDEDSRYTLEAFTHEFTHLLQLATTGYAYDFAVRLFGLVASAVRSHVSIEAVFDHRMDYTSQIATLFQTLHVEGDYGITPRAILESAAFLAQKVTHYPGLSAKGYEQILDDEAPSGEYRLAYDVAVQYLGVDALEQFPHVANLALCAKRPEIVFPALLEAFKTGASRLNIEANHRLGVALLNESFSGMLLGSASDLLANRLSHPILQRIVLSYNELANEGRLDSITLIARGRVYDQELANLLIGPTLFLPMQETGGIAPMWVPSNWKTIAQADRILEPTTMRLLCACSQILQQDIQPIEPLPLRPPSSSPVASEYDVPLTMRNWVFTRDNRTSQTASHLANMLRELGETPAKVRALRGTVAITFPDEEFPGDKSPLGDVGVQTFLRQLFELIPHLLYFLSDMPPLTALLLGIAAFVPEALGFDGDRAELLLTDQALTAVAFMEQNAARFARLQGQSPSVVFGHLGPFDVKLRTEIERRASER
jgi:hypothetical protein